jgi:threonine synthase
MNYVFYTNNDHVIDTSTLCSIADQTVSVIRTQSLCIVLKSPEDVVPILPRIEQGGCVIVIAVKALTRAALYSVRKRAVVVFVEVPSPNEHPEAYNFYDVRILVNASTSKEDIVAALKQRIQGSIDFQSTRNPLLTSPTTQVLIQGIAQDGGLFIPGTLPSIPMWELALISQRSVTYQETAQLILERFFSQERIWGSVLSPQVIHTLICQAYSKKYWRGEDMCPLRKVGDQPIALLELFHGPTSAFKDFALQLFPRMFASAWEYSERYESSKCLVLAATSGDTGIAAIQGFVNAQSPSTKVLVLYPLKGVSEVQRQQMLKADGAAARVIAVDSDFDFCQSAVKSIFASKQLNATLQKQYGTELSSANSINWGRLAPQIVYYFHAYFQAVKAQYVKFGDPVQFIVPTGNFGNILCCDIARRMGLPMGPMILASNENNVLSDFVKTGVYDIRKRSLFVTASPSIDILRASNVERFLWFLTGNNSKEVARCMASLDANKIFEVSEDVKDRMKQIMRSGMCTEEECAATIAQTFKETNIIIDTHTAVALHVAKQHQEPGLFQIVASTAHFAKFPDAVLKALRPEISTKGMSLQDIYRSLREIAPQCDIPPNFLEPRSADASPERTCEASLEAIESKLLEFLASDKKGHISKL